MNLETLIALMAAMLYPDVRAHNRRLSARQCMLIAIDLARHIWDEVCGLKNLYDTR